jgi:hypothetical protein
MDRFNRERFTIATTRGLAEASSFGDVAAEATPYQYFLDGCRDAHQDGDVFLVLRRKGTRKPLVRHCEGARADVARN